MGGDWKENILKLKEEQTFAMEHGVALPEISQKVTLAQQVQELEDARLPDKENDT